LRGSINPGVAASGATAFQPRENEERGILSLLPNLVLLTGVGMWGSVRAAEGRNADHGAA